VHTIKWIIEIIWLGIKTVALSLFFGSILTIFLVGIFIFVDSYDNIQNSYNWIVYLISFLLVVFIVGFIGYLELEGFG